MSEQPRYKLTYYNARGLAEPIRMMFAYAGVEYEDIRVPITSFSDEYIAAIRKQYFSLPILEVNGVTFTQPFAITSYVAKKYDLAGEDEIDEFRVHECCEQFREYFYKWLPLFYDSTPEERKEKLKERLLAVDTPFLMSTYNEILAKNNEAGSPWMYGNKMTYADICVAHYMYNFHESIAHVDLTENYPLFKDLRDRVFNIPQIKEWIAKRPDSYF